MIPGNQVLLKECQIVGVNTGQYLKHKIEEYRDRLSEIVRWTAAGKLRPHISATYRLDEAPLAIAAIGARSVVGKIVITVP